MQLKILGSGGGEGYPALFCSCEHCTAARRVRGKNLRSLSQSLVDGKLLIDLPADTFMHFLREGIDFGEIEHLLITHTHNDHYVPNILDTRGDGFAPVMKVGQLHIYGNADVKRLFDGIFALQPIRKEIRDNIIFHTLTPFRKVQIGGYRVTPLKANHDPSQVALNYIIDEGECALLYLLDSGYPAAETLEVIEKYGKKFACVVMDGTMGVNQYVHHMNFAENIALKQYLEQAGAADKRTRFITAHITHNHAGLHESIEKYFEESGIVPAYDGMTVEF